MWWGWWGVAERIAVDDDWTVHYRQGLANVTEMHINIARSEQNVSFIYFLGLFNSS